MSKEEPLDDVDINQVEGPEDDGSTKERNDSVAMSSSPDSFNIFRLMARFPAPFMLVLPIALIIVTALGWSQDDIVEAEVANIWIPRDGAYWSDKKYAEEIAEQYEGSLGGSTGVTTLAAISVSRDGGNLLTAERLEEIRQRLEKLEKTTIVYNDEVYTFDDICSSNNAGLGTAYQFACSRISPMDYYFETRTLWNTQERLTWYNEIIRPNLIEPRVPRFGTMQRSCTNVTGTGDRGECNDKFLLRTRPEYAVSRGLDAAYANPLALFGDIGAFEEDDPCKVCIEEEYEITMQQLLRGTQGLFGLMALQLQGLLTANTTSDEHRLQAGALLQQVGAVLPTIDRAAIEEFYLYYVARGLYGQLGSSSYQESYGRFGANAQLILACRGVTGDAADQACKSNITETEAVLHLLRHADSAFSSNNTAGLPFPFYNSETGYLLDTSNGATLGPIGGSGIDLSGGGGAIPAGQGQPLQGALYFDLLNAGTAEYNPAFAQFGFNPFDETAEDFRWEEVMRDPVFVWFTAGVTEMNGRCGNDPLKGSNFDGFLAALNEPTAAIAAFNLTQTWCTEHSVPFEDYETFTQQHFAKLWYDRLMDSPEFLKITEGESDPYSWTNGQGCGYTLRGQRFPYTGAKSDEILNASSGELYFVDEGLVVGAIDRNILVGNPTPPISEYSPEKPLQSMQAMQHIYAALFPEGIVDRVKNCNRPGGPLNITEEDAEEILLQFKEAMEDNWNEGWDDENFGEVQFVSFFDDRGGVIGTSGRLLEDITLSGGTLMTISFLVIVLFSVLFLASLDIVESRVLVTLIGVVLVILSFFAALGVAILGGVKLNITIGWTLPFIMIGLGVDDMYIVSLALRQIGGYSTDDFVSTMTEVAIPVTMTSVVNFSMFSVMNLPSVAAIYLTAQAAMLAVVFLYLTVLFCFPAFCWLDMVRQRAGRWDGLFCVKSKVAPTEGDDENKAPSTSWHGFFYLKLYKPFMVDDGIARTITQAVIWLITIAALAVSIYGMTQTEVGLGLEDFFPADTAAGKWATYRTEYLASWPISISWGAVDYTNPDTQLKMMKQLEDIVASQHVSEVDTARLWVADFALWSTRQCDANFVKRDADTRECGADFVFLTDDASDDGNNTACVGTWRKNTLGLRIKNIGEPGDACIPRDGGVCRPTKHMHPVDLAALAASGVYNETNDAETEWCPVFEGFSNAKFQFCLEQWRNYDGGSTGGLVTEPGTATPFEECSGDFYKDDTVVVPVPISQGPRLFGILLNTHSDTLDLIKETRAVCDDDKETHCWMSGIPYDYWEQYATVEELLYEIVGISVAVGFVVAFLFIFAQLKMEKHETGRAIAGSLSCAVLIALICIISVVTVIGFSSLWNVTLTAFSDMAFVLSIGFAVEYAVHICHRFLTAPMSFTTARERVEYAMQFLFLPTFMSFASSTIGVVCLAFTDFNFNEVYFFRPLLIVMFSTYFYGVFFLPSLLSFLNMDFLKVGK